ncbi:MAG: serine/threonine protein kinase [Xanthomonadales bacterium]|nr:serine/threonine protein kinase [Xanthomonadales bacterium]MBP6077509.1 serine/threonine protein kinase [Xanthomonadales bacterium]MBP7624278.1 serine/threonine protein kinase [Xanthomonadales bacterium]
MNSRTDPEHWRVLQTELDAALALAAEARQAHLAAVAARSPDLAAELASLLSQLDNEALPDAMPLSALAALEDDDVRVGYHIGPFVIDACIGEGGSGIVYRAHRDGDFAQTVAIKVLQQGRLDAAGTRRLQHERDLLARLDHPGIVRLLDAGVAQDGRPYLALELVEGRTLDRYLVAEQPSAERRLQLFAGVCDAVAYGHQRLLVHRDIKPGNLMVGADGRPKLLDYGIGKLIGDDIDSTLTRDFGSSLTPAYAAPEQLRGEPVTTATDVHALGLLLFELLGNAHPFRQGGRRDEALRQALLYEDAPSLLRQAGQVEMPHSWRADLDRIVAMALEKEPQRRYASARELGEDVRAVLAGKPVTARRATTGYVLRRFVGRHRAAVSVVAACLLMLVVATVAAVWQARIAATERERAERRFDQVHQFANTVLFDYQEGIRKLGGSLPMQQRLVADALRYLESLSREAGDDVALLVDTAAAYVKVGDLQGNPFGPNIGDLEGAARSYAAAAALLDRMPHGDHDRVAANLLGAKLQSRQAELRYQAGELRDAKQRFERALATFSALPASTRTQTDIVIEHANVLDHYGDLLGRESSGSLNEIAASRRAHEQARALREAAMKSHPDDAGLRFGQYQSELRDGEYWIGQNDMAQAATALDAALETISDLAAADPDDSFYRYEQALVHSRLVPVREALGDLDASVASALQALATTEAMLARDPGNDMLWQAVSASCGWAARQLLKAGRARDAMPIVARQIEVNERWRRASPDNPEASLALSLAHRRHGELREALGDFPGAVASHREALSMQAALVGHSPDFALSHALSRMHLGRNLVAAGDVASGRASLLAAANALAALAAADPDAARFRDYLAEAWAQVAEAHWHAPADVEVARRAVESALAIWAAFEAEGRLSPTAASRRDALRGRLQDE